MASSRGSPIRRRNGGVRRLSGGGGGGGGGAKRAASSKPWAALLEPAAKRPATAVVKAATAAVKEAVTPPAISPAREVVLPAAPTRLKVKSGELGDIHTLVGGRRLSVWWQGEGRWFDGQLRGEVKEEHGRRLERVEYDDGDAEWHELSGVHWMPLSR